MAVVAPHHSVRRRLENVGIGTLSPRTARGSRQEGDASQRSIHVVLVTFVVKAFERR
jgi:hypothetical protein